MQIPQGYITIEKASELFNRSDKQLRRIKDEGVSGKKNKDGTWAVYPDPLFAEQIPLEKGYGFMWVLNHEKLRKHFELKAQRQMDRIEKTRGNISANPSTEEIPPFSHDPKPAEEKAEPSKPLPAADAKIDALFDALLKQLETKDKQLASLQGAVNDLIKNVEESKSRSDSLQLSLISLAGKTGFEVKQLDSGKVEIIESSVKPHQDQPEQKKSLFRPSTWFKRS